MSYPVAQATDGEPADDAPFGRSAEPRVGSADPFHERRQRRHTICKQVLGGNFRFESDSEALLQLVEAAYGNLPSMATVESNFHIELSLVPRCNVLEARGEPPPVRTRAGAGFICGVMDAANYTVLFPAERRGLVVASYDMLEYSYHLRYELIEFAVFVLAARGMGLVPLHGACVGQHGRGVLLLGASGAGKSTLALHCLLHGMDFLAEDAVFVRPQTLLATGVANYLHLRPDMLPLVDEAIGTRIAASPTIQRRSGVKKFEMDVRRGPWSTAAASLTLTAAVFVCSEAADDPDVLLTTVPMADVHTMLSGDQTYAAGQPGWWTFVQQIRQRGIYRLARGSHPQAQVDALRQLLG